MGWGRKRGKTTLGGCENGRDMINARGVILFRGLMEWGSIHVLFKGGDVDQLYCLRVSLLSRHTRRSKKTGRRDGPGPWELQVGGNAQVRWVSGRFTQGVRSTGRSVNPGEEGRCRLRGRRLKDLLEGQDGVHKVLCISYKKLRGGRTARTVCLTRIGWGKPKIHIECQGYWWTEEEKTVMHLNDH